MEVLEIAAPMHNGQVNGFAGKAGFNEVVTPIAGSPIEFPAFPPTSTRAASAAETTPKIKIDVPKQPKVAKGPADPGKTPRQEASRRAGRGPAKDTAESADESEPTGRRIKYVAQAVLDAELDKLERLSQAVLAGDTAALDRLRAELDNCPHVWQRLGDLQLRVELKFNELVFGKDPLRCEALRKRCSKLRHELLEGEPASLATKMAASRVVASWYFVQLLDLLALELPEGLRLAKQLQQAERRFQDAMKTYSMARQSDVQLQLLRQRT
jgi:hypothetical protein